MKKIVLHQVSKSIRGTFVIQDISLTLEPGRIYGLKGVNGSGKTMLMRLLCGLIRPTSGKILFDDLQLGGDIPYPPSVGILLENPSFLDGYSGFENLKLIADIRKNVNDEVLRDVLKQVGLDSAGTKKYKKYSLGMKQRVGIAAAIMERPELLLLDEPFNALDGEGADRIEELIREERDRGALVVLSCHDTERLRQLSDQVIELSEGKILRRGL